MSGNILFASNHSVNIRFHEFTHT